MSYDTLFLVAFIISPIVVALADAFRKWFEAWLIKGENS